MGDLKITTALTNDLLALQRSALSGTKGESSGQAEDKQENKATRIDVDPGAEKLAKASIPPEQIEDNPAISEQAARLLALDIRQNLQDDNAPLASDSEKTILSLFG